MDLKNFFNLYLTKSITREKVQFLNKELEKLIDNNQKEEESLLFIFVEILNGNMEEAKNRCEDPSLSNNKLLQSIGKGIYYLNLGIKNCNSKNLNDSKKHLEEAVSIKDDIPFLYVRLAKVYRFLGFLSKKDDKTEENYYKRSIELINEGIKKIPEENKTALAYFYNRLGDTYLDMRQYDEAKDNFMNAINIDDKFEFSYNGMGNYYRTQRNYEEAIDNYEKALSVLKYYDEKVEKNEECVYPLNYIGDCYRIMEDYKEAEEKYIKAILVNRGHAYPWHGLGRIFYELGNRNCNNIEYYKIAKEYIEKSLSLNDNFKYALYSYACVNHKIGDYETALAYYERSAEAFPKSAYHEAEASVRTKNITDKQKLNEKIQSLNEMKSDNKLLPAEKFVISTVEKGIEDRVFLKKDSFTQTFLKEKYYENKADKNKITLDILRQWNSYTPIITDGSKGGGYFVKAFGKGIVIDPGFNFIDNFKDAGYTFADIDIVLISHAHDDHTADLESIINLLYRYNKELKENKIPKLIAKENNMAINPNECEDIDTDKLLKRYKKILNLYISEGVMRKYRPYFKHGSCYCKLIDENTVSRDTTYNYGVKEIKPGKPYYRYTIDLSKEDNIGNPEIKITAIKSKHKEVMGKDVSSIGFIIDFGETVLIYTGDTGWSKKLENQYSNIKKECAKTGKYVILLAHIGGFDKAESNIIDSISENNLLNSKRKIEDNCLYDNHLGRIGIIRINEVLQPDICIISEFGEEFKGLRQEVAQTIREAFDGKLKTWFIPADIGLKIDIAARKVRVINEIDRENRQILFKYVDLNKVAVGECQKLNKLFYYNNESGITESDCLQAILENFKEEENEFCMIDRHKYILKLFKNNAVI